MFRILFKFIIRMLLVCFVMLCLMGYCTAHIPDPDTGFTPMGEQVFVPEGKAYMGEVVEINEGSQLEEWAHSFDPGQYPDYVRVVSAYPDELRTELDNGILYGEVDDLGRLPGAAGWITNDMRSDAPDAEADIMDMKGNVWAKVPGTPGRYGFEGNLFKPVNLIPPSLGGDNASHNIVRGTVMLDEGDGHTPGGLSYTESLVNDYLDTHPDGRVWYNVVPVYGAGEVIPRAIVVGIATEDGELSVRAVVFNAANGLDIDYKTGEVSMAR